MGALSLTLRLGWRNLWRNPGRTGINLAAMAVGTAALIVTSALTQGLVADLGRNATSLLTGEAQAHAPGFLIERSIHAALPAAAVETLLAASARAGLAAAPRQLGYGLLARGSRSAGVELLGVDPAAERAFGGLPERVARGVFLPAVAAAQVVIGDKLARALEARPGDELVAVVQAADGSMGNVLFRVGGVLAPVGDRVDRGLALLDCRDFEALFSTSKIHEVAITSHGAREAAPLVAVLQAAIGRAPATADGPLASAVELRTWRQLLPQVAALEELWGVVSWLMGAIFFLAAGLGVLNAMLMAQYERIPELGLLKALGTTPGRIVADVLTEALVLGLISLVIGGALGGAIAWRLQEVGWDLAESGSMTLSGVTFSTVWRAKLTWGVALPPVVMTSVTALFAALWPAIKAARLDPVEAMNHV